MSTLPGLTSKGEKGKSKFHSLNINHLYKDTLGQSSEKQQQKNTLSLKHGMQSLGKVPSARRPPANLPSIKSEHSGTDTAVSLVPSNGPGWGKQETSTSPSATTTTISNTPTSNTNTTTPQLSAHQAAIALPVTNTIPVPNKVHPTPAVPATGDKSWSAVMAGSDPTAHPPPYQSPQFQHEFPSLSAGDGGGGTPRPGTDTQYGPGPSLRPQTEGSWIQGGSRGPPEGAAPRTNSGPLVVPPQLSAPAGQPPPPQYRSFVPPFMFRGNTNFPANGHSTPPIATQAPVVAPASAGRGRTDARGHKPNDLEELAHRPIIKEEELSGMDNLTGDMGWALHDDIDYNQKLAFSDDESKSDKDTRKHSIRMSRDQDKMELHSMHDSQNNHGKMWSRNAPSSSQVRAVRNQEEEEIAAQRRLQEEEVQNAIKRAKQRKEEEEKKYLEAKQNAAKKLQKLNEKASKSKRDKENDESVGSMNPSVGNPQTISAVPSLQSTWDRDRDIRAKSETDDKPKQVHRESGQSDFRQLTQIEGRSSFSRKDSRGSEKDQNAAPSFSRQFQSNLPPRFLKQQQQLNATSNTQPISFSYDSSSRWMQGGANKTSPNSRKGRSESEEKEREEDRFRRHAPLDEGFRSHRNFSESGRKSSADNRYDEYRTDYDFKKDKEDDKRDRNRPESKPESFDSLPISRQNSDEWHSERRIESRYDRPQRPDSRDSRASRDSRDSARHSEPRDYTSWPESHCEDTYEEKKKEHRMQVPGPITKEKMEAEDMRSEKRNLTQLKKGIALEKKATDKRDDATPEKESDDPWSINRNKELIDGPRNWADAISPNTVAPENPKFMDVNKSAENLKDIEEEDKKDKFMDKDRDDKRMHSSSRGRSDSQGSRNQGWGGGNSGGMVYRTSWSNKKGGGAGRASRGGMRQTLSKGGSDWHGTESEGSADDNSTSNEVSSKSPKPMKKFDKDDKEKLKDFKNEKSAMSDRKSDKGHRDFVPRGEPSRHGRGGGGFRGARGGCKRIDGYGPPVKSPFSHHDQEKDKKSDVETNDNVSGDDKSKTMSSTSKEVGERKIDDRSKGRRPENRRNKARNEGDISDNSDDTSKSKKGLKGPPRQSSQSNRRSGNSTAPRLAAEKRGFGGPSRNDPPHRQNSSGSLRGSQLKDKDNKDTASVTGAIADMSLKNKDDLEGTEVEVEGSLQSDSDGFQEVKSKKTGKTERPKIDEKPKIPTSKAEKDLKNERKTKSSSQLSQQQIANIPSLMATPIKPPANIPQPQNKTQFERPRINKLPPRLAKQREQDRLHKTPQMMGEMNDLNKVNQSMYMKEGSGVVPGSMSNAWEKPLASQLRGNMEQDNIMSVNMDSCKPLEPSQVLCQNNATTTEDKTVLDGTKPLNTIIFENTNFKSAPGSRSRNEKPRSNKMDESIETSSVLQNYNKPIGELLNKNDKADIQMQLSFNKEDAADMKLDFFESEISHLTDDKSSKNIGLPRTMHNITSSNSTISPSTADALNIKIQSVKKVWESMPTVMEHAGVGQDDAGTFSSSFGPDPNSLDPSGAFSKGTDTPDDNHEVYSPSPNNQNASNSTTNVCKVKPTQQVAGSTGQTVLSTGTHQQHSGMVGPGLMGHPLSPPPMQPVIGGGVGLGQPPQQFTASQHISYQASLGGSTQYGMPAIPSPPNVLYNSTQQLQAQTGLYGAFQIDQSQVLNNQGRSQYSQYSYGLGQTASSPYSQSMYLQTAQPHAPPTAQAPPDLYTNYRIPAAAQFGQSQQLSNPTTVLISSTSNSLMSATVKPSNQQISAIGTKAGGVGQAYQQQAQQGQQLYMAYEPLQANYLQNTGVMQRGPAGPVQNSVVPGLQPSALQASSSYYSGNTGGQAGYFQQPGSSTLQSAQMPQHQAGYGLQGSVFGTHNQSHTSAGMQNYGSPFLSNQIQLAAAINAQQYRSATLPNTAYMKSVGSQQITDQSGRSQQLKSPGSQQDGLSSVFNSGSQIPSPKSRQNCKQPPPQQSPTAQHKYLYQQTMSSQQTGQARYPTPIQRPVVNYQPSIGAMQQNNGNQKHRNTNNANNRATSRQYYGGQGGNLNNQSDKTEDSKLSDNVVNVPNTSISTSSANIVAKAVSSVTQSSDKSDATKEENSSISKD